ncbi:hypothetical protein KOR34_01870 [Posidoniimonas corsicana]|uniref:Uncharacterized protein n=1 Tax=Posidoniimonas corsicana TaxID=1938618 RepID=A0A5C5VBU2_9BACT|nr:hypothetical protein KOR34_01870 [Posidoniimonas corsicana]
MKSMDRAGRRPLTASAEVASPTDPGEGGMLRTTPLGPIGTRGASGFYSNLGI